MNLIDRAFLLKKTALFGSLDLDLLLTTADRLELITQRAGEKVFQLDQDAHRMYLIIEGEVLIQDKEGSELARLGSGEFFGDEALFQERARGYEATSTTQLTLLALARSHLLSIIEECPSVAIALLEAYTRSTPFRQR